ncbi:hypothetical protein [Bacillus sp. ISL-37]|jgi:hypothetical protein|uniref:hypothetical protein n=1 Tax=Bacillus sp. ISL-37 TaxID=2819123 RepID=UPI001BEC7232|nr:hypothetical protein [Bacillus sp. ISL-37]MBT2684642.1 hypothetical protein [Bacillus sp. ISL-37]
MSREKKEKVIHVDKLTIHAKEVEIIQERARKHHGDRRHPWGFFGPRRRFQHEHDDDKHIQDESSSSEGKSDRHRGPRWL